MIAKNKLASNGSHDLQANQPFTKQRYLSKVLKSMVIFILVSLIRMYRYLISPLFPPSCRYQPTCSAYALEALELYGPVKGSYLATKRILNCHPLGGHGFDPVPPLAKVTATTIGEVAKQTTDNPEATVKEQQL